MITGTIFGLLAALHVVRLVADWGWLTSRPWFMVGMATVVVVSGALSVWAFRLLKATGKAAA